jgi:hypothetical protein
MGLSWTIKESETGLDLKEEKEMAIRDWLWVLRRLKIHN